MTTQNYLMVNKATNVVENICVWDGDIQTWNPPSEYLMLIQATTPAMVWMLNTSTQDYELQEQLGQGGIGFIWDGQKLTTNQPKPEQPKVSGTQTL